MYTNTKNPPTTDAGPDWALVTGAAGGIGRAIARRLADDGMRVVLADRDARGAEEAAAELPGTGHVAIGMDVGDPAAVRAGFDRVEAAHGPVRVFVNCAGILLTGPGGERSATWELGLEDWDETFRVNTRGAFLCCSAYVSHRLRRPVADGRVITISSVTAQLGGYRANAAYIASKSALIGLTKVLAREVAPLGITANAVAPGLVQTEMYERARAPGQGGSPDAAAVAAIPAGRIGTPQDVAHAVAFLASRAAGYVTGSTVDVNGGYRMQ